MKYIDAEKLIAEIERWRDKAKEKYNKNTYSMGRCDALAEFRNHIVSSLQEQPANMIQWTGSNLQEVIDFTGKSPKFGEWFKSWDEFESYVHSHGDILKLFCEDGSHYEVPAGAWIVKTPDGYNVPSIARFIHAKQEQPDFDDVDPKHLVHSHYTKVRETKTGRVFWAEYSSEAAEWYEAGTGKAYSISDVEIVKEQPKVDLVAELKHHLATTPKEQLEKEWKELEPWGNIGPTVQEFLYGRQPEVDLEKEYKEWWETRVTGKVNIEHTMEWFMHETARHFYELGLNTRREE